MGLLEDISNHVQAGYPDKVKKTIEQALQEGVSPTDILHKGLIAGMNVVADRFKTGQMFLPEVLAVAGAMKSGMSIVKPLLAKEKAKSLGKIVLGTVRGDMHDIGKNLVGIMLEGAGFDVTDLGTDVRVERFVEAVRAQQPDVVGLSALLTTTMVHMKGIVEAFEKNEIRSGVKVIVGGAPISQKYADEIRADGYARDAASAVDLVRTLLNASASPGGA